MSNGNEQIHIHHPKGALDNMVFRKTPNKAGFNFNFDFA